MPMKISRYWFRTRNEKGSPKTNLSLEPKPGYQIRCRCQRCNEEFNRRFGLDDFELCAGCRSGDRSRTPQARQRASNLFSKYYASKENRQKKSEITRDLYSDSDFAFKQRIGCQARSSNPTYIQKLKDKADRGVLHSVRVSCGKQGIQVGDFSGFITGLDELERQRCKDTVGKECLQKANYSCHICGRNNEVHAHHLNGWHWAVEERFDIDNLICLCHSCHIRFHQEYGSKNNTREQFEAFERDKKSYMLK